MHLRQEHRARAEVIAADFRRRERFGVAHVGVADDGDVVAERLERREALGERSKSRPTAAGDHMFFLMPNAVLPAEPCTISMAAKRTLAARGLGARAGRHHGLEERQRHGDANALQNRAAGQVLLREIHRLCSCLGELSPPLRATPYRCGATSAARLLVLP